VDVAVDALLPKVIPRRGTTANAQVAGAYQLFRRRMSSERAVALLKPARRCNDHCGPSTSTKSDVFRPALRRHIDVADETVNTMPDATLAATLDHGNFASSELRSDESVTEAAAALEQLPRTFHYRPSPRNSKSTAVNAFVAFLRRASRDRRREMQAHA